MRQIPLDAWPASLNDGSGGGGGGGTSCPGTRGRLPGQGSKVSHLPDIARLASSAPDRSRMDCRALGNSCLFPLARALSPRGADPRAADLQAPSAPPSSTRRGVPRRCRQDHPFHPLPPRVQRLLPGIALACIPKSQKLPSWVHALWTASPRAAEERRANPTERAPVFRPLGPGSPRFVKVADHWRPTARIPAQGYPQKRSAIPVSDSFFFPPFFTASPSFPSSSAFARGVRFFGGSRAGVSRTTIDASTAAAPASSAWLNKGPQIQGSAPDSLFPERRLSGVSSDRIVLDHQRRILRERPFVRPCTEARNDSALPELSASAGGRQSAIDGGGSAEYTRECFWSPFVFGPSGRLDKHCCVWGAQCGIVCIPEDHLGLPGRTWMTCPARLGRRDQEGRLGTHAMHTG